MPESASLRADVREALAGGRLSQREVAQLAGVAQSTFNQWLGARYEGRPEFVEARVSAWLVAHRESYPVARPAPAGEGWRVCPRCPPDDCLWPESAFVMWHQLSYSFKPSTPICGACLLDHYPRSLRACATCGAPMPGGTRRRAHVGHPQCRRCIEARVPSCMDCKADLRGRVHLDLDAEPPRPPAGVRWHDGTQRREPAPDRFRHLLCPGCAIRRKALPEALAA